MRPQINAVANGNMYILTTLYTLPLSTYRQTATLKLLLESGADLYAINNVCQFQFILTDSVEMPCYHFLTGWKHSIFTGSQQPAGRNG